jgi:predicted DsbA family dithiol-disulfide isomerase
MMVFVCLLKLLHRRFAMTTHMKIDFVSDVSCPWCVIGLQSLEAAVARLNDEVSVDMHFQPFELNPQMAPEGEDIVGHIARKYGSTPQQIEQSQEIIRSRGAELGFRFDMQKRERIYNTFDAHRLLHWAEIAGRQPALKHALFNAYFTAGLDPSKHEVLINTTRAAGLDPAKAREILDSDEFAKETREREQFYLDHGIHAVPSIIVNERHLIQGGQPVEVFEQVLRRLAAEKN